jgi:hypothetical protein
MNLQRRLKDHPELSTAEVMVRVQKGARSKEVLGIEAVGTNHNNQACEHPEPSTIQIDVSLGQWQEKRGY